MSCVRVKSNGVYFWLQGGVNTGSYQCVYGRYPVDWWTVSRVVELDEFLEDVGVRSGDVPEMKELAMCFQKRRSADIGFPCRQYLGSGIQDDHITVSLSP